VWTEEQHKAFVAAIQKYPSSLEKNERWNSIGAAVPGKTKKQCLERFKVVRAKLVAKKQQGAPAAAAPAATAGAGGKK
jgi:DnaJ homolog subfamily C member 2